jgi:hypothetical protein
LLGQSSILIVGEIAWMMQRSLKGVFSY